MEAMNEMIPFAMEMFLQGPSRRVVKMYVLGTTLAFFGIVGGLVETVCLPFAGREPPEEEANEQVTEKEATPDPQVVEVVEVVEVVPTEVPVKVKPLGPEGQRSKLTRGHAC